MDAYFKWRHFHWHTVQVQLLHSSKLAMLNVLKKSKHITLITENSDLAIIRNRHIKYQSETINFYSEWFQPQSAVMPLRVIHFAQHLWRFKKDESCLGCSSLSIIQIYQSYTLPTSSPTYFEIHSPLIPRYERFGVGSYIRTHELYCLLNALSISLSSASLCSMLFD